MQLFNNIWLTPCYHPSNPLMNKDPPGWCLLTAGLLSPVKSLVNPLPPASCSPCHGPAGSPGYWEICLNISDGNQNIRKCKESFSWRVFKIWGSITRIRPRLYKCHINTLWGPTAAQCDVTWRAGPWWWPLVWGSCQTGVSQQPGNYISRSCSQSDQSGARAQSRGTRDSQSESRARTPGQQEESQLLMVGSSQAS